MAGLLKKLFGTYSSRELKRIEPIVDRVEALEDTYKKLTEEQLRGKTAQLPPQRLERGETLEDILPDAFATVREASARVLGLRHYRVAAHRRRGAPPGAHRRDEDGRRQDAGGHPARLSQRP